MVSVFNKDVPLKNSTFVTVPSGSEAVALIVMVFPCVNDCPLVGESMETVGF